MICYDVSQNGKRLCVAGAPGYGVLGVDLTWVMRDPARRRKGERRAWFGRGEQILTVGGTFGSEHLTWVPVRRIHSGDVIRVRVSRRRAADAPAVRRPVDPPPGSLAAKRAYVARMERYVMQLRREARDLESQERAKRQATRET